MAPVVCKALVPASPGEQVPGGSLQGACIHSSCRRGLGSSAVPGEATGNAGCARAKRDRGSRGKQGNIKEEETLKTNRTDFLEDHPVLTC